VASGRGGGEIHAEASLVVSFLTLARLSAAATTAAGPLKAGRTKGSRRRGEKDWDRNAAYWSSKTDCGSIKDTGGGIEGGGTAKGAKEMRGRGIVPSDCTEESVQSSERLGTWEEGMGTGPTAEAAPGLPEPTAERWWAADMVLPYASRSAYVIPVAAE
jgi:hypothetical protein